MSDLFKERLKRYEQGLLKGEELIAFEKELEKLEQYQSYLEENNLETKQNQDTALEKNMPTVFTKGKMKKKILRRSKWKARLQTALTAVGIIILFVVISTVLTTIYYAWGKPDRTEVFRNVIDHTLTITEPYGYLGSTSTNVDFLFRMNATRDIRKKVGDESINVGELHIPFLFSKMGFPERKLYGTQEQNEAAFTYPGVGDRGMADWDRLEHLPNGTVVTAYVSFNELVDTATVLDKFSSNNFDVSWLAVDTGVEGTDEDYHGIVFDPIGFPTYPIWHDDDFIQQTYEEEGNFFFKSVSESYVSPEYEDGDTKVLHEQFLKTLHFLKDHEKMAEQLYAGMSLNLEKRVNFLEDNGFHHYGIAITGPTKEILKLKEEDLVQTIELDEIGFWNWQRSN